MIKLDDCTQIIDIKGSITKEFAVKQKLFEIKFMDLITLLKYKNGQFVECKKLSNEFRIL
ncbi:DUF1064 domain-containing protein [Cytobacillus praedii]|uniref:DUF1064 domain-containing protein n=1 Tax=Cytobacillus praedii TaxID=1742358 RepID=UPI0009EBBB65|nr:DUF1064 domain-containing protein [Cytobacillus praedii]MED3552098.1 DUF1064 domain-containing protein [Cytobacillus praedii]